MFLELNIGDNDFRVSATHALKFLWEQISYNSREGGGDYTIPEGFAMMEKRETLKPFIKRLMIATCIMSDVEVNTRFIDSNLGTRLVFAKSLSDTMESMKRHDKYFEQIKPALLSKCPQFRDCNGEMVLLDLKSGKIETY